METAELTNMCMIRDPNTGKVLVQDRVNPNWPGIAFPGGHVEPGESIVDSVIREVKEETNLDISQVHFCGMKDWYSQETNSRYFVFLFSTSVFEGNLIEDGEEGRVFWVDPKEIPSMRIAPNFDWMLKIMENEELNENFIAQNEAGEWRLTIL